MQKLQILAPFSASSSTKTQKELKITRTSNNKYRFMYNMSSQKIKPVQVSAQEAMIFTNKQQNQCHYQIYSQLDWFARVSSNFR